MRIQNLIITFCLLISIQYSFAQSIEDSLSTVLQQKDLSVENRVMTLGRLARALPFPQAEKALKNGQLALQLSRTIADPKYITFALASLVQVYYQNEDMSKAKQASDSAIWYAGKTTDRGMKGFAWFRKAWLENLMDQPKDAVKSAIQALKYLEGDPNYYEAGTYYIMAGVYAEWNDRPAHRKYAELCIQTAQKVGDYDYIVNGMQSMASWCHNRYRENNENKASLDSCLLYNRTAINLYFQHRKQIISHNVLSVLALNTADLYRTDFPATYKDSVFHYLNIAIKVAEETNQVPVMASCYSLMSEYEMSNGNYQRAEAFLAKGLSVLLTATSTNTRSKMQLMEEFSRLEEKKGNPAAALKYYKEYNKTQIELFDAEKLSIAKRLDAQYQSEKNEAALKALNKTASLNRKLNYLYIFLAVAAITALLFLFLFFHFRLKASLQQQKLLEKDKEDAELHARLKEEETMRSIAEQQLLQERQDRLQRDLLAGSLQVEQKDELLQAVQKKIEENKNERSVLKQINQIIDQNKRIDDTIGAYKADFDNINPEFFEKLKEKSANTLSRLDLKHCSYISIGLTNKEIAQRLGIAPKSILMARYRIKLKLGLGKDTDLDEYIGTL